jgi:hypothetical protein
MLSVAFVDPESARRRELRDLLLRINGVQLVDVCENYDQFAQIVFEMRPDVAIVAIGSDRGRATRLIAELVAVFPGVRILALLSENNVLSDADHDLIRGDRILYGEFRFVSEPLSLEKLQCALADPAPEGPLARAAADAVCDEEQMIACDSDEGAVREGDARPSPMACCSARAASPRRRVPFPPQFLLPRLLRGIRRTSKRLCRSLLFSRAVGDVVDCTVFAPPAAAPGDLVFIQAFAHLPEQAEISRSFTREFDAAAARRGFKSLEAEVNRGTRLTFHLTMPGTEVDDPVQDLVWRGEPESVQFAASIPDGGSSGTVMGTVSVSQDSIPMGHVKFKLTVTPARAGQLKLAADSQPVDVEAHRYRKAFVSYASPDRPEVLKRVQMLARLGIAYFQDVLELEPGDRWEKQLYRHIDESDLFLLSWSTSASKSEWVLREMRYALRHKGGDDLAPPEIKPVIIEGPPSPPPPQELSHLHFSDYFLYFINSTGR